VAQAAYRQPWRAGQRITLRQGARVIEESPTDAVCLAGGQGARARRARPKNMGCLRAIVRGKVCAGPAPAVGEIGIGTAGLARPVEARQVGKLDRDLLAALYKLGFDSTDDKIAEIKGDMTIRLLRPFDSLLKFVVELPDGKKMIFDLDEHTQVEIIEATKRWQ
jgi:hypothetical protein